MLSVRGRATPGREAHGACRYLASVSRDGEPRMLRLDDWRCVRLWPAWGAAVGRAALRVRRRGYVLAVILSRYSKRCAFLRFYYSDCDSSCCPMTRFAP
jgi:hypothetical protein